MPPSLQEALVANLEWANRVALAMVKDSQAAQDLVQETMRRGLENPPADVTKVRPWIASVMRNVLRMRYRTSQRRDAREDRYAKEAYSEQAEQDLFERAEAQNLLSNEVVNLPDDLKLVLLAHYWDNKSLREIGKRHEISPRTVEARLRKARQILRDRLDQKLGGDGRWMNALLPLVMWKPPIPSAAPTATTVVAGIGLIGATMVTVAFWINRNQEPPVEPNDGLVEVAAPDDPLKVQDGAQEPTRTEVGEDQQENQVQPTTIEMVDVNRKVSFEGVPIEVLHVRKFTPEDVDIFEEADIIRGKKDWVIVNRESLLLDTDNKVQVSPSNGATHLEIPFHYSTITHSQKKASPPSRRRFRFNGGSAEDIKIEMVERRGQASGTVMCRSTEDFSSFQVHYWVGRERSTQDKPDAIHPVQADGSFQFSHVLPSKGGFTLVAYGADASPTMVYRTWPGDSIYFSDIPLPTAKKFDVRVKVVDSNGKPLAGAEITHKQDKLALTSQDVKTGSFTHWAADKATTGEDGVAELSDVFEDSKLLIYLEDYALQAIPLTANTTDLEVVLNLGVQTRGMVIDENGAPIADARITLFGSDINYSLKSKENGQFINREFAAGQEIYCRVEKEDYGRVVLGPFDPIKQNDLTITLKPDLPITGRLITLPNQRPAAARLICTRIDYPNYPIGQLQYQAPAEAIQIEADGSFTVSGLAAGTYLLHYQGRMDQLRMTTAVAGQTDVVLEPLGPTNSGGRIGLKGIESVIEPGRLMGRVNRIMKGQKLHKQGNVSDGWWIEANPDLYLPELLDGQYGLYIQDRETSQYTQVFFQVKAGARVDFDTQFPPLQDFQFLLLEDGNIVDSSPQVALFSPDGLPYNFHPGHAVIRTNKAYPAADGTLKLERVPLGQGNRLHVFCNTLNDWRFLDVDSLPAIDGAVIQYDSVHEEFTLTD